MNSLPENFKRKLQLMLEPKAWDGKEIRKAHRGVKSSPRLRLQVESLDSETKERFYVGVANICTLLGTWQYKSGMSDMHVATAATVADLCTRAIVVANLPKEPETSRSPKGCRSSAEKLFIHACYASPKELAYLCSKTLIGKSESEWLLLSAECEDYLSRIEQHENTGRPA